MQMFCVYWGAYDSLLLFKYALRLNNFIYKNQNSVIVDARGKVWLRDNRDKKYVMGHSLRPFNRRSRLYSGFY